jgi:hypothetical protein
LPPGAFTEQSIVHAYLAHLLKLYRTHAQFEGGIQRTSLSAVQNAAKLAEQEELNRQPIAAALPAPASQAAIVYALNATHGKRPYVRKRWATNTPGIHKPSLSQAAPPSIPKELADELAKPQWRFNRTQHPDPKDRAQHAATFLRAMRAQGKLHGLCFNCGGAHLSPNCNFCSGLLAHSGAGLHTVSSFLEPGVCASQHAKVSS